LDSAQVSQEPSVETIKNGLSDDKSFYYALEHAVEYVSHDRSLHPDPYTNLVSENLNKIEKQLFSGGTTSRKTEVLSKALVWVLKNGNLEQSAHASSILTNFLQSTDKPLSYKQTMVIKDIGTALAEPSHRNDTEGRAQVYKDRLSKFALDNFHTLFDQLRTQMADPQDSLYAMICILLRTNFLN